MSTSEQNPDLQVDELTAAGCWKVWVDHASGSLDRRPQLDEVLAQLRPGDTLVVWRLDRLGRSLRHLIDTVTTLDERGVGFRSLRESIDTTTAGGRLVFHLFGALAQFEREIIRDRTVAGLAAARVRGRVGGRPSKLSAEQRRQARKMYDERELTVAQIGEVLGVSRTSIFRALAQDRPVGAVQAAAKALSGPEVEVAAPAPAPVDAPERVSAPTAAAVKPGRRPPASWFLVEADDQDRAAPVAVVSRHANERAAKAALARARTKHPGERGASLEVRTGEQIIRWLEWDADRGRPVVREGPPLT